MASADTPSTSGGLKGLIQWVGQGISAASVYAKEFAPIAAQHLYKYGGGLAFILATTSMITLLPLVMESDRESRSLQGEKLQVRQLKNQGMQDRELSELGFSDRSVYRPSVAAGKV